MVCRCVGINSSGGFLVDRLVGVIRPSVSLENSTRLFNMLFVFDVVLPVGSHQFHCLLSLEAVEHIFTHQRVLSSHVHLIAESQLLLLVDLSLHIVVFNLAKQRVLRLNLVYDLVVKLVCCSVCVFNWEWVKMDCSCRVNIRVEFVSLTPSTRAIFHLDKVQGTTNWSVHVLELPLSIFLLSLGNLLLPNLSVITLSILLRLGPHRQILLIVFDLSIKFRFFDVSLILKLINLLQESSFCGTKSGSSRSHVLFNLKKAIFVVSVGRVAKFFHWLLEHFWNITVSFSNEIFIDVEFGFCLEWSLLSVEPCLCVHCVHRLLGWLIISRCQEGLSISHMLIRFHCIKIKELL